MHSAARRLTTADSMLKEREELKEIFQLVDEEHKGVISKEGLRRLLTMIGHELTQVSFHRF
jgi:Ca2+-binding EF-hand superfamily protein